MGFEPMTALTVLSTGLGMYEKIKQAQNQAAWMEYNARMAEADARAEAEDTKYETEELRKKKEKDLGKMRALYAKRGVTFEGSPLDALGEMAGEGEADVLDRAREGAVAQARLRSYAGIQRAKARERERAGYRQAGATLLTGTREMLAGYGNKGRKLYIGRS